MSDSAPLAPGFRFHPTDEELVLYYLKRRVSGKPLGFDPISHIEIYKSEPWDLPGQSRLKTRDLEWYFFCALETKYGNGWRTNRATQQGYWKTTGKDRSVRHGERVVGMKKTLVYHIGRAPKGERTNWVMHEYRLVDEELEKIGLKQAAFVLCRVFQKSGSGPKNGEQYGAPFIEEEWEANDSRREIGDCQEEYYQQENVGEQLACFQDPVTAVTPLTGLLMGSDGEGDSNHVEEDPMQFLGNDQKIFIGTGENTPVEENKPEPLQMVEMPEPLQRAQSEPLQRAQPFQADQAPVDHEFFEVEDLLGATDPNYHVDVPVGEELTYMDAPSHDPEFSDGLQMGDLNAVEADPIGFEMLDDMLDDMLPYFDAADDGFNYWASDSYGVPEFEGSSLNQSVFTEEEKKDIGKAYMELPGPSKTQAGESSSSSEQSPEIHKDVEYNKGWEGSFAKQVVSRMLGSIPAPTAYASEIPTKEAAFGQNSATHPSSSVHVTAGMICISGSSRIRSSGKTEDGLFSYDMTVETVISNYMEPMSSKTTSVIMRSGYYYFILFWVLILSASCKIGSYIYCR